MSKALEGRVRQAHPLAPAHRMVLLQIAWDIPDGQTEALVNQTVLAAALDTSTQTVRQALDAGDAAGLCRKLKNGRVSFTGYDVLLGQDARPAKATGVREAAPEPGSAPLPPRVTPQAVLAAFSAAWKGRYRRDYPFTSGRDHAFAKKLASYATLPEIAAAAATYVADDDPYYAEKACHAFTVFVDSFNRHLMAGRRPAPARGAVRDADATRRYIDDLRRSAS